MLDHALFNTIYKRYCQMVHYIVFTILKNRELAEDALQQTFIKVYRNLQKFRGMEVDDAGPLIGAIARNTAIDIYRKFHNMQLHEDTKEVEHAPDHSGNTLETLIAEYDLSGLRKYLPFLNDEERDLLILKYYYVFTVRDISKLLGISNAAATSRLYRLKCKIARLISEGVIQNEE